MISEDDRKEIRQIIRTEIRDALGMMYIAIQDTSAPQEVKDEVHRFHQIVMPKFPEYIRKADDLSK